MNKWAWSIFFIGASVLILSSCSSARKSSANRTPPQRETTDKARTSSQVGANGVSNEKLYAFVEEWKGTPYKYGGNSKDGTDCSGFVGSLYAEVYQLRLPRTAQQIEKSTRGVDKQELKEGDLLFFDINGKKSSHVGVYLFDNKFVHASTSKGVVISNLENPYYQKTFAKGGRL